MQKLKTAFIVIFLALALPAHKSYSGSIFKIFKFDEKNALNEWKEKIFKNKVFYNVETAQSGGFLSAESVRSCSGLFYKIRFNPNKYPLISWKWKVIKFPDKNKVKNSEGGWLEKDDYPARVYIIFPSIFFKSTKCIEYVWDEKLPEGTIMTSPYMKNIKIIVIESGRKNINNWVYEKRNIPEDYINAFGKNPPHVGAIALMTDADNTLSTAEALYAEIKVRYKDE